MILFSVESKVFGASFGDDWVVSEMTESQIAVLAEECSVLTGFMTVVYDERSFGFADGT